MAPSEFSVPDQNAVEQLRELPQMVGIEHAVHMGIALFHPLGDLGLAHHAAADENLLPRMAALGVDKSADVSEDALLGVLADGAGVDDDHVGVLRAVGQAVAAALQHAAKLLGIRLVLLAAVGLHVGQRRLALALPEALDIVADLSLTAQVLGGDQRCFPFQSSFLRLFSIQYPF